MTNSILTEDFEIGSLNFQRSILHHYTDSTQEHGINVTRGVFCNNILELRTAFRSLKSEGFEKCVIKVPYGSSGKGLKIIQREKDFLDYTNFISRRVTTFELLIEGWHEINKCINSQLLINENNVNILAISEQIIDDQGGYRGTNYSPMYEEHILKSYLSQIAHIGEIIKSLGYRGIAGIDSIVDTKGNIYPVVEINARFTQVTYLLPIIYKQQAKYRYHESRFYNFQMKKDLDFEQILYEFENIYRQKPESKITIYTYCKSKVDGRVYYRIFILFSSNTISQIYEMISIVPTLLSSIDH